MSSTKGGATEDSERPASALLDGKQAAQPSRTSRPKKEKEEGGARAYPKYHHRDEEYIFVTRDDLKEVRSFGWMQQALFGVGTFLFSGAFWLLIELTATQSQEGKSKFTAWMGMCVVSMIAGLVLGFVGLVILRMREARLVKYFQKETSPPLLQSQIP